jgi:hypothetical protein
MMQKNKEGEEFLWMRWKAALFGRGPAEKASDGGGSLKQGDNVATF